MANSSPSLHLLLLVLLCMLLNPRGATAEEKNQFIFNGFKEAKLHLEGDVKILPDGLLQLTNTSKHKIGHAFYSFPISFSDGLSFSATFVFAMVPEIQNIGGHGIAFVISPPATDFRQANPNQYLGLLNASNNGLSSNHLLAVELDTVWSPEFGDMDDNHVGIDLNNLSSIAAASVSYYDGRVNRSLKLISGKPMQVWIEYREVQNVMDVRIAPMGSQKPNRPLLSKPINLSSIILNSMQVGFSSSTGAIASNHYILGWSFNRTGEAQSLEIKKLPSIPKHRKGNWKTGGLSVLLIIVSVLLVLTVAGVAYFLRMQKYEEIREDWERQYGAYRDIKASNVLLDAGLNGRLGDFGLARFYDLGAKPGHDPRSGYGGVSCTGADPNGESNHEHRRVRLRLIPAREKWKSGVILEASDPNLEGEYSEGEIGLVLKLGLLCSHSSQAARPSMRRVMQYLGGDASLPEVIVDTTGI
ncbi:unnamed protein product [Thlaspi arvense]|uniref:Legume lectin domain-containing protein n=1 Tax=Thlaspi arvense TaxID=13288 RepID=A0AAU9S6H2_THLAR|nr:unnamed protein product [Thlaspi arvense]